MDLEEAYRAAIACSAISRDVDEAALISIGVQGVDLIGVTGNVLYLEGFLKEVYRQLADALLRIGRGYVLNFRDEVMIAFRGTAPISYLQEPTFSGDDLVSDLDALVKHFEAKYGWMLNLRAHSAKVLEVLQGLGYVFPGFTHPGFSSILAQQDWSLIEKAAEKAGERGVILAGHSQGGAIAALAASRLTSQGYPVRAVYTFGAPRPGDSTFRSAYQIRHFRFESAADPVPLLCPPPKDVWEMIPQWVRKILLPGGAPGSFDYRHVGSLIFSVWDDTYLPEDDALPAFRVIDFIDTLCSPDYRKRLANGHDMPAYLNRVAKLISDPPRQLP